MGSAFNPDISSLLESNKQWAKEAAAHDANYFHKWATSQSPDYLCIGCADSRVPPNTIFNKPPGEIFVHRNIGALVNYRDLNCLSCIEYSVDHLKVRHIIVVGHYNCGGCKATLLWHPSTPGVTNLWLRDIREVRDAHAAEFKGLSTDQAWDKLVELNTIQQAFNVAATPTVQAAWARGQPLAVHGLVYQPADGSLKELIKPITGSSSSNDAATADVISKLDKHCLFADKVMAVQPAAAHK